jgi:hypothetical protein
MGLVPQQQSAPVEKWPREGGWRVETDSMAMVDGVTRGLGWTVSSPPLLWWGHTWGGEENEKEEEGASWRGGRRRKMEYNQMHFHC